MTEPIARRVCKIRWESDKSFDLYIDFFSPRAIPGEEEFKSMVRIECRFFNKIIEIVGGDAVQALFLAKNPILAFLQKKVDEGYSICWLDPGDLNYTDFWEYRP